MRRPKLTNSHRPFCYKPAHAFHHLIFMFFRVRDRMTHLADSYQLEQKLIADVRIGQVMHLRSSPFSASFAPLASALEHMLSSFLPCVRQQIFAIPLVEFGLLEFFSCGVLSCYLFDRFFERFSFADTSPSSNGGSSFPPFLAMAVSRLIGCVIA